MKCNKPNTSFVRGPQGPPGPMGLKGRDGIQGNDGASGETGAPGPTGATGPMGASPPAVLWSFAGTISTDQNDNIPRFKADKVFNFAAFDVNLVSAPTGSSLIVEFKVDAVTVATVTVPAGSTYTETVVDVTVNEGSVIYPIIYQVGSTFPGTTAFMRART